MLDNFRTMLHCLATLLQGFILIPDTGQPPSSEVSKCPHYTSIPITQLGSVASDNTAADSCCPSSKTILASKDNNSNFFCDSVLLYCRKS